MSIKAMKQALEAIQDLQGYRPDIDKAIETLHTAIQQAESEPVEISPEFTDTARAALLWVLWHHQGGSSPVGQPIRYALGMGAHDHLNDHQVIEAERWASITGAQTSEFHTHHSPGVPDGWSIEEKCGDLIVRKNGYGGYSAKKNTESIAEAVLHELALDLLAASPA